MLSFLEMCEILGSRNDFCNREVNLIPNVIIELITNFGVDFSPQTWNYEKIIGLTWSRNVASNVAHAFCLATR